VRLRSRAWAVVVVLLVLTLLGSTARPTSAAWTNSALFAASASSGSWASMTCEVIMPNGQPRPGATCGSITVTMSNVQALWVDRVVVGRRADGAVTFSQTGWSTNGNQKSAGQDVVRLTLDMSAADGGPADWNHSTSAPFSWSNLAFTSQCSRMPVLVAETTYWVDAGQNSLGFAYAENRAKVSPVLCQP
jgi:hypothetical protein